MGRYSNEKRAQLAAQAAAQAASEAGRTLQAQRQNAPAADPPAAPAADKPQRPDDWVPPRRNEPRRLAMEEIEAREQREMEANGIVSAPTPKAARIEAEPEPQPEPEPKKAELPPEPVPLSAEQILENERAAQAPPAAEPNAAAAVAAATAPVTVETVRVKVDGEEFDAPKADVEAAGGIHAYQRERAAENRLKKSNEVLAETKRTQAMLAQIVAQQTPKAPEITDDEFIKSKVDTIRFGTPEESAAALREVLQRTNKQQDPNMLIEQAVERVQLQSAGERFNKDFQDIVANPLLLRLAINLRDEGFQQIAQARQQRAINGPIDWNKFFDTIGNQIRSVVQRPSQPAPTATAAAAPTTGTPSQGQSEKEARKASIVNLPTAAARAAPPADSKPETREEILNSMRKQRGQPTG